MTMNRAKLRKYILYANSQDESKSPYLPPPRGLLKEKLIRLRSRITYWIWKRQIEKYSSENLCMENPLHFLDVGCGSGDFVCCLENWFPDAKIIGLDNNPELIKYTINRAEKAKLSISDAEELPFDDSLFHVVSCLQVIEHLPKPEKFLSEANRILKKGGLLLLATPNPEGLAAKLLDNRWGGYREDHISLRPPRLWHKALQQSGFNVLNEGTTLFNGIPLIGCFPLGLPFQLLQAIFGYFSWQLGSSYMAIAEKDKEKA